MPVEIQEIALHRDARGVVFEPLAAAALAACANVHVVVSRPGAVRGNHLHRRWNIIQRHPLGDYRLFNGRQDP